MSNIFYKDRKQLRIEFINKWIKENKELIENLEKEYGKDVEELKKLEEKENV